MEVARRAPKYAAKWMPRNKPLARHSSTSRRVRDFSSRLRPASTGTAISAAEKAIRYSARIRDGAVDHRTNTADRDTPATPSRTISRFMRRAA